MRKECDGAFAGERLFTSDDAANDVYQRNRKEALKNRDAFFQRSALPRDVFHRTPIFSAQTLVHAAVEVAIDLTRGAGVDA